MAKKYINDAGFLIIEMSYEEAKDICEFGAKTGPDSHFMVCDNCNIRINPGDTCYYFSVLNRLMCKECADDIIANQTRYKEDIPYEKRHYNYYAKKLNLDEE